MTTLYCYSQKVKDLPDKNVMKLLEITTKRLQHNMSKIRSASLFTNKLVVNLFTDSTANYQAILMNLNAHFKEF